MAITRMCARGSLHRIHRGVYAVGHTALSRAGEWMAAVLAVGEGAVLSHLTAASLWNITRRRTVPIEILVGRRHNGLPGVTVHQARRLTEADVDARMGLPVTSLARTIVDLADTLTLGQLVNVIKGAEYHHELHLPRLREFANGHMSRRGARVVTLALQLRGAGSAGTRSRLEDLFLALLAGAGIGAPLVGVKVRVVGQRIEVDCLWPAARLIVEVDGRGHRRPAERAQDRVRDDLLRAAGYTVLRVGEAAIRNGAPQALREIRRCLAEA
jgi:Protein of unknown function (DUF559)